MRQNTKLAARSYRACRRVAQARSVVLVAHPPPAGARPSGVNGSMRPHDDHEDRGAGPRGQTRARLGVAPRCAGEAAARGRAAAYSGFTPTLPHAGAARRALEEGGRQLGLRPGPVRTLSALLGLYRGWGLRRPPVLAATNAAIARAVGCGARRRGPRGCRGVACSRSRPEGVLLQGGDVRREPPIVLAQRAGTPYRNGQVFTWSVAHPLEPAAPTAGSWHFRGDVRRLALGHAGLLRWGRRRGRGPARARRLGGAMIGRAALRHKRFQEAGAFSCRTVRTRRRAADCPYSP